MSQPPDGEPDPPEDFLSALRPGGDPAGPPAERPSIDGLDPDLAIIESERPGPPRLPPPVIDTRKYQFIIGGVGVTIFLAISIFLFAHGKSGLPGYAPGQRLHEFVAPLARSDLGSVAANAHPFCNPAHPSHRGLNVCDRRPIVLAFFYGSGTAKSNSCIRQVDALQADAARFPEIQFAAVAVNQSKAATAKLVKQNHWTIPVAYDLDDTIGQLYGVEVCPMVELARAGGIVQQRLIGDYWADPERLARAVTRLG